jgi:hypothetical protein
MWGKFVRRPSKHRQSRVLDVDLFIRIGKLPKHGECKLALRTDHAGRQPKNGSAGVKSICGNGRIDRLPDPEKPSAGFACADDGVTAAIKAEHFEGSGLYLKSLGVRRDHVQRKVAAGFLPTVLCQELCGGIDQFEIHVYLLSRRRWQAKENHVRCSCRYSGKVFGDVRISVPFDYGRWAIKIS